MICTGCKEDLDIDCYSNKVECFELVGEVWCDSCFESHCERNANRDPKEDDHDKYGDPINDA